MIKQNRIAELLHGIFSEDAIQVGAICEQLEDLKYCTEHKMNHLNGGDEKEKWEKAMAKCEELAEAMDGKDNTYTIESMKKFQNAVNDYLKQNPKARLLEGLTNTEHFAVRRFYYYNCH